MRYTSIPEQPAIQVLGPLTAGLAALKLAGVINCPWSWVLAPLWVPYGLTAVCLGVAVWADHGAQGDR